MKINGLGRRSKQKCYFSASIDIYIAFFVPLHERQKTIFQQIQVQHFRHMKIGIYCSANDNIDPDFFAATEELGRWCGKNGHSIVFGGCDFGLMKCVSETGKSAGATIIGVVPSIIEQRGKVSKILDVEIPCDNLSDRKDLIVAQSDVFVALPGGLGTLDEIFTVAAAASIGYHNKVVILYNMKGFWNSTIAMLNDMQGRGFIRGQWNERIKVADTLEDVTKLIESL